MTAVLDVVVFNYLDRPIFEVRVGGIEVGLSSAYPTTGGGTMTGVRVKLGLQDVSWRLDGPKGLSRNGESVIAVPQPSLAGVLSAHKYLGVHIYSDNTAELLPTEHYPELSKRGEQFDKQWRNKHGK